jgi:hypothetical protein
MNDKNIKKIDFSILGGKVYIGRENGQLARDYFHIDEYDLDINAHVNVVFPESSKSLSSSFFLAMFGKSIITLGSQEAFIDKYKFTAKPQILQQIEQSINRALVSLTINKNSSKNEVNN